MKRSILILLTLFFSGLVQAQFEYKTGHTELVRFNGERKLQGWNVEPVLTWMYTRPRNYTDRLDVDQTSVYNAEWNPAGRFWFGLMVGRHHILKYMRYLHVIDYGLGYKGFRGREKFEGVLSRPSDATTLDTHEGDGKFAQHFATAYVNVSNIWQFSDNYFLQNSIGMNVDFRFLQTSNYSTTSPYHAQEMPGQFVWQLHYRLGLGIKIHSGFFITPTIETPILNVLPWNQGRSQFDIFNSRYRPVMIGVRFSFLGKNSNDCPPVYGPENDRDKQDSFFMEG